MIAGSRSFAAIGQWAADAGEDVLAVLGAGRGPAEGSTFRRAFALLDPGRLDQVLGAWLWTRAVPVGGRLVIAIDGKAVRGAKNRDGKAPHLVAALAHGIGAVLGQAAVDAKPNEIPAVRDLLKAFASLAGAVITIGALHTQSDTAQVILGRDADYVMTVKGNMPTLYRQLKELPWARIPATSSVSKGHGRRARRTIKVALAPAWIGFAGAAQVAQLRRTVAKNGKKTVEVVYLITSDRAAGPVCPGRLGPRALAHREQAPPSKQDTTTFHDTAAAMRVWAKGLLGLEAAVELLIGHGTWLTRADFAAAALASGRDGITGAVMMSVDFEAALAARRAGGLPCSSGEEQILALAASIAAGVPVALGDLVCGLDEDNAVRVAIAVLHAAGFGGRSVLVTRGSRR